MSKFDSIDICVPNPKMISLQEESPEIPFKSKKSSPPTKLIKPNPFSPHKKSSQKSAPLDLLLSSDISNNRALIAPPTPEKDESENNFRKYILGTIKNDDELTLKEKITFSFYLVMNTNSFNEEIIREFNEEECHLSLVNWIWRYNKKFKEFKLQNQLKLNFFENFDNILSQYNKLLIEINIIMELLINILNFFVFLPINSSDILRLKLYEKLIKIKGNIKSYANEYILNLINLVLNKWKSTVDEENEQKIITRHKLSQLGIKHPRSTDDKDDKEDTEADSVDYNEENKVNNINNNSIIYSNSNLNKKTKNNIKVSFDLQQNQVIYFQKDDIPFQITLDKQKNKK
jgi:hypothetical protein